MHGDLGDIGSRCRHQRLRIKAGAPAQQDCAFLKIAATLPHVFRRAEPRGEPYRVRTALRIFLHDHGIGTVGKRCAREDANRLTRRQDAGERGAGPRFARDLDGFTPSDIAFAHRIAIHR